MSDHPKVAKRGLAYLHNVSHDVWLDTLFWIERAEVGMKFALVDARFDGAVDVHFNMRKWTLGELSVQRASRGSGMAVICVMDDNTMTKELPIATSPAPSGIVDFESIFIWYVDVEVIAFLQFLQRIINKGISVQFTIHTTDLRCWTIMAEHIWPLLSNSIITMYDMKTNDFLLLHRHVSTNVLFDCSNLRRINSHMFPEPSANYDTVAEIDGDNDDDAAADSRRLLGVVASAVETPYQQLYRWLHIPRADGGPKMLTFTKWRKQWRALMPNLKRTFLAKRSTPVKYIVTCAAPPRFIEHFEMENERTDEQLTSESWEGLSPAFSSQNALVVRCPIGTDQHTKGAWHNEANQLINRLVLINITDKDIGPSLLAKSFTK